MYVLDIKCDFFYQTLKVDGEINFKLFKLIVGTMKWCFTFDCVNDLCECL